MPRLDIKPWNDLEEMLLDSTRLEGVLRWEKYVKRGEAREENSLQHSYKASLLAVIVLENEAQHATDFNPYFVLKATLVHDIGEIETGDTVYIDKTEEKGEREYAFFRRFISRLPEHIQEAMDNAYNLQNAGKEGFSAIADRLREEYPIEVKLFEAIERLGYIIFAYREFRAGKEKIFIQTLRNQYEHLIRLADDLPGFGSVFYNQEIQRLVEEFLERYDGKYIEQKGE